jgi:hypothetical protein
LWGGEFVQPAVAVVTKKSADHACAVVVVDVEPDSRLSPFTLWAFRVVAFANGAAPRLLADHFLEVVERDPISRFKRLMFMDRGVNLVIPLKVSPNSFPVFSVVQLRIFDAAFLAEPIELCECCA